MADNKPTHIGEVISVGGSTVTVLLDSGIAGAAPIYEGQVREVGQVGSFIRFPQGLVDLFGTVSSIQFSDQGSDDGNSEQDQISPQLEVHLIGQRDNGTDEFERGVGTYPGIGDPVHLTTAADLDLIFPDAEGMRVQVGKLSSDPRVPITLNMDRFVTRHATIVGQTGAGKTNTVATVLQNIVRTGFENCNIIVIDPHGEYEQALEGLASVQSVLPDGDEQLEVPYWAFPFEDILKIFADGYVHGTFRDRFDELVTEKRRDFVEASSWLDIDPSAVTRETPVPFDIHEVWHQMDYENNETVNADGDACINEEGDPEDLTPTEFERYDPSSDPPNQGDNYGSYGEGPDRLRYGLQDPQLGFIKKPKGDPDGEDPLSRTVKSWLGNSNPISVLDFKGVPTRVTRGSIGVIMELIFELAQRSNNESNEGVGIGRPAPVLLVLEEAHRYLGGDDSMSKEAANRIAREGRKYGIGLLAVTQRPSEIPETVFSQMGTIVSLRLTNGGDKNRIRAALPDVTRGLADVLPSLRTHEAIISGEAVEIPVRMSLQQPDPYPDAEDPSLDHWLSEPESPNIEETIKEWRELFN